jgi:hypothetical protein
MRRGVSVEGVGRGGVGEAIIYSVFYLISQNVMLARF